MYSSSERDKERKETTARLKKMRDVGKEIDVYKYIASSFLLVFRLGKEKGESYSLEGN